MWKLFRKDRGPVALEEQVATLASCGIRLAPGVSPESLLISFARKELESEPYRLTLVAMGGEAEDEAQAGPNGYPSDNIWHFDTECIEDHGAYAAIASRLRDLAQGDLPLEDISDSVDIEAGSAWLEFRLDGEDHHWDAEVEDDWVDPAILSRFAALLEARGRGRRFTYIDLGGQDCLLGCSTEAEMDGLRRRTGLKVEWLK